MTYRAFVSSTFEDLRAHRAHAVKALHAAGFAVDPMEEWTADPRVPVTFSADRAKECDLLVLLVAMRRGFVPPGDSLSVTQLEYKSALEAGLDVLVFMLHEDSPWHRSHDELNLDPKLRAWRQELQERHGVSFFYAAPESLAISPALTRWVLYTSSVPSPPSTQTEGAWNAESAVFRSADKQIAEYFMEALDQGMSADQQAQAIRAAATYARSLQEMYDLVQVFGMDKPVPLRDIFIRIHLLDKVRSTEQVSLKYLEAQFDHDKRSFGIAAATRDGSWLSGQGQFMVSPEQIQRLPKDLLRRFSRLSKLDAVPVRVKRLPEETAGDYKKRKSLTFKQRLLRFLRPGERPDEPLAQLLERLFSIDAMTYCFDSAKLSDLDELDLWDTSHLRPLTGVHFSSEAAFRSAASNLLGSDIVDSDWEALRSTFEVKPGKFIVLGRPGAGKSTLLKFLALRMLTGRMERFRIPVFVGLKDTIDSREKLIQRIVSLFAAAGAPMAGELTETLLKNGRLTILLDGLDEIGGASQERTVQEISKLSALYDGNEWIISCRVAAYNHWFPSFTDVELADFGKQQIDEFVRLWFADEQETALYCLEELNSRSAINELGSNPLLLTLLCLAFNRTFGFPSSRSEIYQEAIDALLRRWDASRRVRRAEIYRDLSPRQKETMFARIAEATFLAGQYFIPGDQLAQRIEAFLANISHDERDRRPDGAAVLNALEAQHGLLVARAQGIYSFSHLTLQEYFAARYIASQYSPSDLESVARRHFIDPAWREVFLLATEMFADATGFVRMLLARVRHLGRSFALECEEIDLVARDVSLHGRVETRALLMAYILGAGSKGLGRGSLRNDAVLGICHALIGRPWRGSSSESMEDRVRRVGVASGIAVDEDGDEESLGRLRSSGKTLDHYLAAQELLLSCVGAKCHVSQDLRAEVRETALLPDFTKE